MTVPISLNLRISSDFIQVSSLFSEFCNVLKQQRAIVDDSRRDHRSISKTLWPPICVGGIVVSEGVRRAR